MIDIREPMWNLMKDGRHFVGIAVYKIDLESNPVGINILYKNKQGVRTYPNPLYITKSEISKYPIRTQKGLALKILPISAMKEGHTH